MFKIRDLMIKVIPPEAERQDRPDLGKGAWCGVCTGMDSCGGCTFVTCVGCSQCSPPSGGGFNRGDDVINPGDLSSLKAALKQRLAVVEAMEKGLEPQNLEEVEVLERKLTEALADSSESRRPCRLPRERRT